MSQRTVHGVVTRGVVTCGLLLGAALLAGGALAQQKTIAIGTGGTGGVYYPLGGGLANLLSKHLPGYQATAVMLGESGLCLAFDGDKQPELAGILTPAAAMGDALTDRLRAAGLTIEVSRS